MNKKNNFEFLKTFKFLNFSIKFSTQQKNRTTGINYTVEYDAMSEVPNATFPFIMTYPNGSEYLKWYNGGGICVSQGVNDTYYNHKRTFVSVINGTIFNQFINWLPQDNKTYNHYETWCVFNKWNGADSRAFINSSTCVDFNWRGFYKLYGKKKEICFLKM